MVRIRKIPAAMVLVAIIALVLSRRFWMRLIGSHDAEIPATTIRQGGHNHVAANIREEEWHRYSNLSLNKTRSKRLPDVIGIGVKKCGTDAAISFLSQHPFVKTPRYVEAMFFHKTYEKGLEFYKDMMPKVTEHELVMEKSPPYFNAPPKDLPNRIKQDLPNAKLILILCEPVKRAFSDYTHERYKYEKLNYRLMEKYATFDCYLDVYLDRVNRTSVGKKEDILDRYMATYYTDGLSTLLRNGMYSIHLPRWTKLFDSTKLLILNGDDLIQDPGSQMEKMQEFLGIPKLLNADDFVRHPETGLFCIRPYWKKYDFEAEKKEIPGWHKQLFCLSSTKGRTRKPNDSFLATEEHIATLKRLYRKFNEELFEMTGIKYF